MTAQLEQQEPEWAAGLNEEQKAAVRREAVRQGKRPAVLVKEWILELSEKLAASNGQHAA